jgi:hypothetical protein
MSLDEATATPIVPHLPVNPELLKPVQLLTNETAQTILHQAVSHLDSLPQSSDPGLQAKQELVKAVLKTYALYSASSNGIPGLRGLGTDEAVMLAKKVLAGELDTKVSLTFSSNLVKIFS